MKYACTLTTIALVISSCSSELQTDDAEPATGPRYVVVSVTQALDGLTTHFNVIPGLDTQPQLDFEHSFQISGNARLYGSDRSNWFAIGDGANANITRYELGGNDSFVDGNELSLASYGVSWMGLSAAVLDPHKAYYLDQSRTQQLIIWDPTTMEVTGTIALPSLAPEGGDSLYATMIQRDQDLLIFGGYTDWTEGTARSSSRMVVVDTATDSVRASSVVENCSHATQVVLLPSGDTYVSSELDATLYRVTKPSTGSAGCLLHVAAGADTFDATPIDLSAWSGTDLSGGLAPGADGSLLFQAFDATVQSVPDQPLDAYDMPVWRWWRWTPGDDQAERLDMPARTVVNYVMTVDGRGYVTDHGEGSESSSLVETEASSGPRSVLTSPGFITNVLRIR
jgi:hypothetical protein